MTVRVSLVKQFGERAIGQRVWRVTKLHQAVETKFADAIEVALLQARTADDVITGRLLSESQTSVEIIDATGTVHPIQRSELKSLTASDKSVMPEGFEALPPQDLTDLLKFLETSKVKH